MKGPEKYYNDNQLAFCQWRFQGGRPNAVKLTGKPVYACQANANTTQLLEHLE